MIDPEISKLIELTPEKPPRSKLEPHVEIIHALRRKRRTYREIATFLQQHLGITVAPSTVHDFVRVRRRRGKKPDDATDSSLAPKTARYRTVPAADAKQKIEALKQRSSSSSQNKPLFVYDQDEPLTLIKPKTDWAEEK